MKLNRKTLRKMILNEIKNLKELNYGPGYTRGPDEIFQLTPADWQEAFRSQGIRLPQSAVFLRNHAWGSEMQYRGHYGLPNHLSQSGYEMFGENDQSAAIAAMNKRVSRASADPTKPDFVRDDPFGDFDGRF